MSETELEAEDATVPVRTGRWLGRYVLCFELASGGMATVYLARTEGASGFDRLVALKVIHPHLAKQREFVDMFLDEAKIAARIVHPNVCSVFDFGEEGGTYFLAMDYLSGETVNRLARAIWKRREVARRPLTMRVLARVIAEAAEGLHAAHESRGDDGALLGVVHRDVTPQNLFVGYDGSLRVVDFGVALAVGRSHHTAVGTLKGKYPYMSPEQVAQRDVDRRSDVWALGVCLWELLTGRRLFRQASEFETLKAVTDAKLVPPSELNPDVPASLDAIVMRALTRDRDQRYATARELSMELSAAIGALGGATAGDVAELMSELFATERVERLALMERARKLDPEHPSHTSRISALRSLAPERPQGQGDPSSTPAAPTSSGAWRLGLTAALVIAAGAVGWALAGRDPPATIEATGGEPVSAASNDPEPVDPEPTDPADPEPSDPRVDPPVVPVDAGAPDAGTDAGAPPPIAGDRPPRERGDRRGAEATTEAEPEVAGTGRLSVVTPPGWAEIYVGRRLLGRSPAELELSAGRHALRIVPYGDGAPIERSVTIEANRTQRLVVRLDPP